MPCALCDCELRMILKSEMLQLSNSRKYNTEVQKSLASRRRDD